jgi:anti-sigma B factor antagonist
MAIGEWGCEDADALACSTSRLDGWTVARVAGAIDLLTAEELGVHLRGIMAGGRKKLVVDLGDATFCDAYGLGVLVTLRGIARRNGSLMRLVVPEGPVRRVFRAAAATHDLEVHSSVAEAVGA